MLFQQLKGGQSGIEMKLTLTQVTLASDDDGTYALNNPEELSEEDRLKHHLNSEPINSAIDVAIPYCDVIT